MAEITYLMARDPAGGGFFTEAKTFFSDRADEDSTVVDPPPGEPWTLGGVLTDLRVRAKANEVYPVINLVAHGTAFGALQFPISEARSDDDGGIVTLDTLKSAVNKAGSDGYPAVLGAPAVTARTNVCLYGCDVGRDATFLTLVGQLFGPELTIYAPLRMAVFRHTGSTSEYRLARSWSTPYSKDVRRTTTWGPVRTDVATKLRDRFPAASADIQVAVGTATAVLGPTYFWASAMDLPFDPTTQPVTVSSAVLNAGTVDDTTVPLTLTSTDFRSAGAGRWTAWVATLGQVLEEAVSLENSTHYRKTVIKTARAAAVTPLVPTREPVAIPAPIDPDPDPVEDPMTQLYGKYRGVVTAVALDNRLVVDVPGQSLSSLMAVPCFPPVPEQLMRMPEVGDELWVEFEAGDVDFPIWTGVMRSPQMLRELNLTVEGPLTLKGQTLDLTSDTDITATALSCTVNAPTTTLAGIARCETLVALTAVVSPSYTPGAGNIW